MRLGWEEIDCIFVDMDDLDLPVMIPDLDIYRSANLLVKQHGEDAPIHAAMRADALLDAGDLDEYEIWKRIVRAVGEFRSSERPEGATLQ